MPLHTTQVIPILRIFDVEKAKEFYAGFLGFQVDWEHSHEENMPVYMQVSLGSLVLHLSEHHGDGCPGASVLVYLTGLEAYHREIMQKGYKYLRPGLKEEWNGKTLHLTDPFGNRLHFTERLEEA
jgi:uncharacterized glyoxalase superfamily protein PhnB